MRTENIREDSTFFLQDPKLPDYPLTLQAAVNIGLKRNLDLRVERILADITDDEVVAEKLKMLPKLDVGVNGVNRSNYEIKSYEDLETGEVVLSNTVSEERDRLLANMSLSWNVLDFGFSYYRGRQALYTQHVRRMERLKQAQKLSLDIATAYWKATVAEAGVKKVRLAEKELTNFKAAIGQMSSEKRVDALAMKTLEKKLIDLELTARKLQANVSGARIDLCRFMGVRPSTPLSLAPIELESALDVLPSVDTLKSDFLEKIALNHRPELFVSDLEKHIHQDDAKSKLLAMFPGLRIDFSMNYDSNMYLQNNTWNNAAIGLASDLLALPSKYYSYKAAGKRVEQADAERLLLTAGVIAQVHLSLHAYAVEADQHLLYQQSNELSTELLDLSKISAEAGNLTSMSLVPRVLESLVAQLERDRSAVRVLETYHRMLVTLGLDYEQWQKSLDSFDESLFTPQEDIDSQDILLSLTAE